jgi:prepilin-type N-terminal cleavage/methylation domain-containing protein
VTARRRADDAGFSLIEIMVTLGVMGAMMAIFTGAILNIYKTTTATETLTTAQAQLRLAFQRFDRELRYATWVALPGKVGNVWYVEFMAPAGGGCRQLRLDTAPTGSGTTADGLGVLQLMQWTPGSPPAASQKAQTLASQILTTNVPSFFERQSVNDAPFASAGANAVGTDFATSFQRLRIQLTVKVAAGTAQIDTTFTALNSSANLPDTANACSEGRPR